MRTVQFLQKKHPIALITKLFSLVLAISLLLPTFGAAAATDIEGVWELVDPPFGSYNGPFRLELFDGQDYGSMVCNQYFGGYKVYGSNEIKFSYQGQTKLYCPGIQDEGSYQQILESTTNYELNGDSLILNGYYGTLVFER